ncbi:MAG: metallophosphoesterase [Burkholderiales bacterium]|nr:metallophosphoesterase [Burkholderiales bacterium]
MAIVRREAPRATGERGAQPPPGTVIYAIGDVHGRADLLAELHEAIAADAAMRAATRRLMVYLGDYVSRFPRGREVLDALLRPAPPGFERVLLKGNHEDIVVRFLDGELRAGRHWLRYGGDATLAEYGVGVPEDDDTALEAARRRFARALPRAHEALLRSLALSHREGGYAFVHAGLLPGVPFDRQAARDLLWIRSRFLRSREDFGWTVVHGHCIVPAPEVRANRIGLDTGAYRSGVLTCLALEGASRVFLQTAPAPD